MEKPVSKFTEERLVSKVRVLSGLVMAFIVLAMIWWAPVWLFKIAVLLILSLASFEFYRMALPAHPSSSKNLGILLSVFFSAGILFLEKNSDLLLLLMVFVVLITFIYHLRPRSDLSRAYLQISITLWGIFYVALLFSFTGLLRELQWGSRWVLLVLGGTFLADTGAYFAGHALGRHKLAPHVSPGKTIEGLVGGFFASALFVFVLRFLFWSDLRVVDCLVISFITGVVGPLGDLSESLIKRGVGIKDSGQLIPGHGGILDRVDALLFTAAPVYFYVKFFIIKQG